MMSYSENGGWSDRLQDFVDDAADSMNFDTLSDNIRNSVQSVFDELNINEKGNRSSDRHGSASGNSDMRFAQYPAGTISQWVWIIAGAFFVFSFGLSALIALAAMSVTPSGGDGTAGLTLAVIAVFLIISVAAMAKGFSVRGRVRRFRVYEQTIGDRSYCQISELAASSGKDETFTARDVYKLIRNGSFPDGHVDDQWTYLILDNETYQQYLDTQEAYQQRLEEDQKREAAERKAFSAEDVDDPELAAAIEEGNNYVRQIREANEKIPGVEITNKLFRLEALIRKIFEVLKTKPDQLPKLRKFMNYYMPTTLKLVTAYQELDSQPVAGENILKAKAQIEESLDTINYAYEKLLDSFFEDAAIDISTDISVLETMFAQEGLTKNQFTH